MHASTNVFTTVALFTVMAAAASQASTTCSFLPCPGVNGFERPDHHSSSSSSIVSTSSMLSTSPTASLTPTTSTPTSLPSTSETFAPSSVISTSSTVIHLPSSQSIATLSTTSCISSTTPSWTTVPGAIYTNWQGFPIGTKNGVYSAVNALEGDLKDLTGI